MVRSAPPSARKLEPFVATYNGLERYAVSVAISEGLIKRCNSD